MGITQGGANLESASVVNRERLGSNPTTGFVGNNPRIYNLMNRADCPSAHLLARTVTRYCKRQEFDANDPDLNSFCRRIQSSRRFGKTSLIGAPHFVLSSFAFLNIRQVATTEQGNYFIS
jgi:hypothetical protein